MRRTSRGLTKCCSVPIRTGPQRLRWAWPIRGSQKGWRRNDIRFGESPVWHSCWPAQREEVLGEPGREQCEPVWLAKIELQSHRADQRCCVMIKRRTRGAEMHPVPQTSCYEVLRMAPGAWHMGDRCSTPSPNQCLGNCNRDMCATWVWSLLLAPSKEVGEISFLTDLRDTTHANCHLNMPLI